LTEIHTLEEKLIVLDLGDGDIPDVELSGLNVRRCLISKRRVGLPQSSKEPSWW
jgi:hypothetical protein